MNPSSRERRPGSSLADRARRHLAGVAASVILAIGAAALIGWLVTEIYVAAVTRD